MTCNICSFYPSNGHMAGNCASMAGLLTARHNNTLKLVLDSLPEEDGGRWPTIAADWATTPPKHSHLHATTQQLRPN
eukprot:scaffold226473_cov15-Prasinocladus_malaysianus.AAC.1